MSPPGTPTAVGVVPISHRDRPFRLPLSTGEDTALLLRLLSERFIFARLETGPPPVPARRDAAGRLPSQVIWFVPDGDSAELTSLMGRIRTDQSLAWLLVSLGSRKGHFLGDFAPRHHYMVREGGSARFYSGWRFHTGAGAQVECVGGRAERMKPHANTAAKKNVLTMDGVHLRLLYIEAEYTATLSPALVERLHVQHRNGTITGGLVGSIILLLQNVFGFTYSLRPIHTGPNTTAWDQAVTELARGKGDMLAGRVLYSPRRGQLVDFSIPFMPDISGAVISTAHTKTLSEFVVTLPLKSTVWWALLATQLVAVLVLSLIARCQLRLRRSLDQPSDDENVSFWALIVVGVSCQQGAVVRSDAAQSYRLAITTLYVLSLFIFACYSGNLLAEMTVERRQMPFDSLSEALDRGWLVSQEGVSRGIQESIVNPLFGRVLSAEEKTRDGPFDGKNLLMWTGSISDHKFNCSGDGLAHPDHCPVCMWPGVIRRHSYSLVCRRRFPYMRLFNYVLPLLMDRGLVSHQLRRWRPRASRDIICPLDTVTLKKTQLGINNLKYMFAIVIAGLLGSIAVLVMERIVFALWMFYIRWRNTEQQNMFIRRKRAKDIQN